MNLLDYAILRNSMALWCCRKCGLVAVCGEAIRRDGTWVVDVPCNVELAGKIVAAVDEILWMVVWPYGQIHGLKSINVAARLE